MEVPTKWKFPMLGLEASHLASLVPRPEQSGGAMKAAFPPAGGKAAAPTRSRKPSGVLDTTPSQLEPSAPASQA